MANSLALLGFFRVGTTEYGAARARTDGSWHMVRKQYGNDSSVYCRLAVHALQHSGLQYSTTGAGGPVARQHQQQRPSAGHQRG